MGKTTPFEERLRILELAHEGLSDRQIAERLRLSPVTVRKWRRRGTRAGRPGLVSHMGRPRHGALSSFPAEIVVTVREERHAHPRWGPKTLRAELARDRRFTGRPLPSRATLARFLHAAGLTRDYRRHSALPTVAPATAQAPHQEWELDARGAEYVPEVGMVSLLDLNDRFSRVRLQSFPCFLGEHRSVRHPGLEDYRRVLRLAFSEWGLPDRLTVDHDPVFVDVDTASPFPTHFHLWLIALGVDVVFSPVRCPTDHAVTERSHQLWFDQVLAGQVFRDERALAEALRTRREFLNECLPCSSVGERPPLVACPEARWPRRPYHLAQEAQLLQVERIFTYLASGRWFRRVSDSGTVSLGNSVYTVGRRWARQDVELTCDAPARELVCQSVKGEPIRRFPFKGLSIPELMGDQDTLSGPLTLQLRLPFTWEDYWAVRLYGTQGGTT